jgi:multicomponent Na+:H+ antiporter subunit D
MNIAALGTAISFAKFIFLPHQKLALEHSEMVEADGGRGGQEDGGKKAQPGFWWAMVILLGGLIAANVFYYQAYTLQNTIKPLATIAIGWLAYLLIFKKSVIKLPRAIEQFDHLIGIMSLMLILLFWTIWTRSQFSI